jgi:hypothetical protein
VLPEHDPDDDVLMAAEAAADADPVTLADGTMRRRVLAVDVDLAAGTRALRFGARPEEARDVEPDVESDGVAQM